MSVWKKTLMATASGGVGYIAEFQLSPATRLYSGTGRQNLSGTSSGFALLASENVAGSYNAVIVNCDADANVNWARSLNAFGKHLQVDSSDNVWVGSEIFNTNDHQWGYYNSSGTFTAQRKLNPPGESAYYFWGVGAGAEDATSLYIPGRQYSSITGGFTGQDGAAVSIINKSTLALKRYYFSYSGGTHTGVGCGTDSSGNIYMLGYSADSTFSLNAAKLNSAGAIQWIYRWSTFLFGNSGVVASDGTSYIVGRNASGGDKGYILKITPAGETSWARNISISGSDTFLTGVQLTTIGNILVTGYTTTTPASAYIALFDTTGTRLWDAKVDNTAGASNSMVGISVAIDGNGNAYVDTSGCEVAAGNPAVISLGDPDTSGGLVAGTYGTYVVTVPSATITSHSPTRDAVSYDVGSPYNDIAGTRTSTTKAVVTTVTNL